MNYEEFQNLVIDFEAPKLNGEFEVLVPASRGYPSLGETQAVDIVKLKTGQVSWDFEKLFIVTSEPLAVLDPETEIARSFWRNLIESYWRASYNGTLEEFYFLLGKKFDEALEKSGKKVKIEETIARTKYLQQKANEARNKANK